MASIAPLPSLTLYGYGPAWGLPDLSPFVLKVLYYCNAQNFQVTSVVGSPTKAPRGKLPYINMDGETYSDSRLILQHLESIHPMPMDHWMTSAQRATGRALQSMLEEHLYFMGVSGRWQHDHGFGVLKPALIHYLRQTGIPALFCSPVASLVRASVIRQVKAQGVGRMTPAEQFDVCHEIYRSWNDTLGDQPFLFGDAPCTLDCSAVALAMTGSIEDFQHPAAQALRQFPRLLKYAQRGHAHFLSAR